MTCATDLMTEPLQRRRAVATICLDSLFSVVLPASATQPTKPPASQLNKPSRETEHTLLHHLFSFEII